MAKSKALQLELAGRQVRLSSPDKIYFTERAETKLDLANYFIAVQEGILRAVRDRPVTLHRFPGGPTGKHFYQKRLPERHPDWLQSVPVRFPSARPANLLCPADIAHVVWAVNLGGFELHPWPVTREDTDHPSEMRIDLDPQPGCDVGMVREAAHAVRAFLEQVGLDAFPKMSGSRGIHLHVPIERRWSFTQVRHACLTLAREMERRMPALLTCQWWKEQRGERVFIDFNQNLRDKTIVAAYAVRPKPHAPVACPITWDEVDHIEPDELHIATVPSRLAEHGDPMAAMDHHPGGALDPLLDMHAAALAAGVADAPWPPHYPKQPGEPTRVAPSRAKQTD